MSPSNPSDLPTGKGSAYYLEFLTKALDDAIARKQSLEQRGVALVTTSSAFATAVFTVVSFVVSNIGNANPHALIAPFIEASVVLFVFSALLGLAVNLPLPYGEPDPLELMRYLIPRELVSEAASARSQQIGNVRQRALDESRGSAFSTDSAEAAMWTVAMIRANLLVQARKQNLRKALLLFIAFLAQVAAVASLAWGVHGLVRL